LGYFEVTLECSNKFGKKQMDLKPIDLSNRQNSSDPEVAFVNGDALRALSPHRTEAQGSCQVVVGRGSVFIRYLVLREYHGYQL